MQRCAQSLLKEVEELKNKEDSATTAVDSVTQWVDFLTKGLFRKVNYLKELGGAPYFSAKTRLKYLGSLKPVW